MVVRPWVTGILLARQAHALMNEQRSLEGAELHIVAQRNRRVAEMALAERRFGEAERSFQDLLRRIDGARFDGAPEVEAFALSGLCVALAAQDRAGEAVEYGERALSLVEVDGRFERTLRDRVLGANVLVRWCVGHFQRAAGLAPRLPRLGRSWLLILMELRGVKRAIAATESLRRRGIVVADLAMLIGDVEAAYRSLEAAAPDQDDSVALRQSYLMGLIELARGDVDRAAGLLDGRRRFVLEPERASRAEAMGAYASAILAAETGDPHGARVWLHRAQDFIVEWGRYGLDRRSRLRALVTVDLALTMLAKSPEQGLAMARELPGKAMALLGDTAEDPISRVLAVKAYAELVRRLPAGEDKDAATRRALELARPLAGLGVPAWDELIQAAT
jgi:ATP/maltotriose-dependent transcriptional regulator MalT